MKKIISLFCVVLSSVVCGARMDTWDTRPLSAVRDTYGASKWWMSAWRTGDQIRMTSKYKVEGVMCVKNKDEIKWYDYLLLRWSKFLESDHNVAIEGMVKTQTSVLLGNQPDGTPLVKGAPVQLIRAYECPISSRGAAVIGLKGGLEAERKVRAGIKKIYEVANEPETRQFLKERWDMVTEWVADAVEVGLKALALSCDCPQLADYTWVSRPAVRVGGEKLKVLFTEKAAETYKASLKRLMSEEFREGGCEAKLSSPLYKSISSKDVDEAINFATCVNNLFMGKTYYIAAAEGDIPFGRELKLDGPALDCYQKNRGNLLNLPDKMFNLQTSVDEEKASGVFTRETLNVNAKLFDAKCRRIGEVWRTDGSILNNFLHPDLKGEFSGEIYMKYVDDREITLEQAGDAEKSRYNVRFLSLVTGSDAKGTSLVYKEEGFKMTYSADNKKQETSLNVYLDIDTGYVVKVWFEGRGEVEMLPKLLLTAGWGFNHGSGDLSVSIDAEAVPTRLLKK